MYASNFAPESINFLHRYIENTLAYVRDFMSQMHQLNHFKASITSTNGDPRAGQPCTSTNDNTDAVHVMIHDLTL